MIPNEKILKTFKIFAGDFPPMTAGEFEISAGFRRLIFRPVALEQSINRPQKSTAGIMGCIRRIDYVTQWELTCHGKMAIEKGFRNFCDVQMLSEELSMDFHSFPIGTRPREKRINECIKNVISTITEYQNPFVVKDTCIPLINIFWRRIWNFYCT